MCILDLACHVLNSLLKILGIVHLETFSLSLEQSLAQLQIQNSHHHIIIMTVNITFIEPIHTHTHV